MIKTVAQMKVSDIFSINSNNIYRIPKYQREYTWGTGEWEVLFNDIVENDKGYFLGSYICVNNGSLNKTMLEVIDGQQRLTTISLLLTALYSTLTNSKDDMDDDESTDYNNLRKELSLKNQTMANDGSKSTSYEPRLILQKQNSNDADFLYTLFVNGIITHIQSKPNNYGNRRISKAFKRFKDLISEYIIEAQKDKPALREIDILLPLVSKIESAVLVGIEVDTNKDAYMLFESLNHRGVPLSALDLIKNTLIAHAENAADADNAYDQWKQLLSNVGQDDYSVQERFFRQYYNAFRDEINQPYSTPDKKYYFGYIATKSTIISIYEQLIKKGYKELLNDLCEKSALYSILVGKSGNDKCYSDSLIDLLRISGAPSYILLLYLLSYQDTLNLTDSDILTIVNFLVKFFVRRNVTDVPNTRKLSQLFIDIIPDIETLNGSSVIDTIKSKLISVSASDALFEEKLRGPLYDENPEATRFLLCSIEATHQTKEIYSDLWSRDKSNKYVWTIEHIFPEGENIPDSWVNMIADGDKQKASQYRSEYVHTLGNLTITGYNSALSNMSFEQKRDRKSKDKSKELGYRNGLHLNKDVVTESKWTISKIKGRTESLVSTLLEMYHW